jgi:hypothetical protein
MKTKKPITGADRAAKSPRGRGTAKNTNPEVTEWFQRLDHPLKGAMLAVREVVLAADPRISECVKWNTPTFAFKGDLASLQPRAKKFVSVMFHRGAEIPGQHPSLEGNSRLVRTMRFVDEDDVQKRRGELEAVVRAWCAWKAG